PTPGSWQRSSQSLRSLTVAAPIRVSFRTAKFDVNRAFDTGGSRNWDSLPSVQLRKKSRIGAVTVRERTLQPSQIHRKRKTTPSSWQRSAQRPPLPNG